MLVQMPCLLLLPLLKIIAIPELILEASSIMYFFQIDSSKFIRSPCPFKIYIDNILHRDLLENLLLRNMKKAKKLRLLISARNKDVRALFVIRCLPDTEAMDLLKNELFYEIDDTEEQMNSGHIEQDIGDMWWSSKIFHCLNNIHKLLRRPTKILLYMECYLFVGYLFQSNKDPFLDICSFVEESELDMLEKRALVTKDTNIMARVYENRLSKCGGNDVQIDRCNMLEKRALVTKATNIMVRVYENPLSKCGGNDVQIEKCKSN